MEKIFFIQIHAIHCVRQSEEGTDSIYFRSEIVNIDSDVHDSIRFPTDFFPLKTGESVEPKAFIISSRQITIPLEEVSYVEVRVMEEDLPTIGGGLLRRLPDSVVDVVDDYLGGFTIGIGDSGRLDWKLEANTSILEEVGPNYYWLLLADEPKTFEYKLLVEAGYEQKEISPDL